MPVRSSNQTDSSSGELGPGYAAVATTSLQRKFGGYDYNSDAVVEDAIKRLRRSRAICQARPDMRSAAARVGKEPCRAVGVGDTISEQGLVAIIIRDPRYHVAVPEVYALN